MTINYPCRSTSPGRRRRVPTPPNDSCGTEFDRRVNPSNSVNIRGNSRFTLTDRLVLTVDPSYQYTKANGGGTVDRRANSALTSIPTAAASRQLLDRGAQRHHQLRRRLFRRQPLLQRRRPQRRRRHPRPGHASLAPSQTRTRRYRGDRRPALRDQRRPQRPRHLHPRSFEPSPDRRSRLARCRTASRSTSSRSTIRVAAASGVNLQKRDRQSYAILNQIAAEYRGEFGALTVNVGARLPFFKRDLENNCFTSSASGFVECSGGDAALDATIGALNPYVVNPTTGAITGFAPPGQRVLKYSKLLPSVGAIYDFTPRISAFASYSKGLSVPSTDNLYNAFFFPEGTSEAEPTPGDDQLVRRRPALSQLEDPGADRRLVHAVQRPFGLGVRSRTQPDRVPQPRPGQQVGHRRLDRLFADQAAHRLRRSVRGTSRRSRTISRSARCRRARPATPSIRPRSTGLRSCAFTVGQPRSGPAELHVRHVAASARSARSTLASPPSAPDRASCSTTTSRCSRATSAAPTQVFSAKAPSLLARQSRCAPQHGLLQRRARQDLLQLNVYNLFDKFYVGGFGGGLTQATSTRTAPARAPSAVTIPTYGAPPFVQIGAPRTVSVTLNIGF